MQTISILDFFSIEADLECHGPAKYRAVPMACRWLGAVEGWGESPSDACRVLREEIETRILSRSTMRAFTQPYRD